MKTQATRIKPQDTPADFAIHRHGSIVMLTPLSITAEEWAASRIDGQRFAGGYVVEWRYVSAIIDGARQDGLSVCEG